MSNIPPIYKPYDQVKVEALVKERDSLKAELSIVREKLMHAERLLEIREKQFHELCLMVINRE
jgi:hypothetical protein